MTCSKVPSIHELTEFHALFLIHSEGYWGVPPWIKGKLPVGDNFPYPFEAFSGWFCAYFTEEVSKGFQDIYDDVASTR